MSRTQTGGHGLPNQEAERVPEANESYAAMVRLIFILIGLGVAVSIEDTINSAFWLTSFMVELFRSYSDHSTVLQRCMHGGNRDKKSKFWPYNLESLSILCYKSHQHASWKPRWVDGKLLFPTPKSFCAAYPIVLCQRMASICLDEAKSHGLNPCLSLQQQLATDISVGKRNMFASQSRGNKLKQVLTECGREATAIIPVGCRFLDKLLEKFHKGANILHRQLLWGVCAGRLEKQSSFLESVDEGAHFETLVLGIPREPGAFISDAVKAGHPKHALARVWDEMKNVLEGVVLGDAFEVRSKCFGGSFPG